VLKQGYIEEGQKNNKRIKARRNTMCSTVLPHFFHILKSTTAKAMEGSA
jgi:hypothetical protein